MKLPQPCLIAFRKALRRKICLKIRILIISYWKANVGSQNITSTTRKTNLIPSFAVRANHLIDYGNRSPFPQACHPGIRSTRTTSYIEGGSICHCLTFRIGISMSQRSRNNKRCLKAEQTCHQNRHSLFPFFLSHLYSPVFSHVVTAPHLCSYLFIIPTIIMTKGGICQQNQ